ncbi:MAG: DUF5674 family protein [Candidatus Omnitrophota bacterium]|nr:DUF5674 family protein [Candidatus Omnitrophota bacterium]
MIQIIRERATAEQIREMLQVLQTYIKLAIDVRRKVIAGGGEMHADCEAVLLEDGSQQTDVWGADWNPDNGTIRFESLINIRPRHGNRTMNIEDAALRRTVEQIVRERVKNDGV